ncbi:MAG: LysE family transporter [Alphaproteobacteria bacterium]|nr:LysE family transporter [Alphaproteobacteria bacterium]
MTHEFITLTIVFFLALVSPGPDFIVIVKQSLSQNSKAGIATSLGIGVGLIIHVAYCMFGLSLIISKSILIFNLIKYIGAVYLIYIGVKAIRSNGSDFSKLTKISKSKRQSLSKSFMIGFLTNLLNPKATLFMVSMFSLVIKEATPEYIKVFYGVWMFAVAFIWFSFVSLCFSNKHVKDFFIKFNKHVDRTLGAVLILFGIKLFLIKK